MKNNKFDIIEKEINNNSNNDNNDDESNKLDNIVIGIEGLVGAGKTSICKELLNFIPNSVVLHAGDVYRAVVFKLLEIKNKMGKTEEKSSNLNLSNINIKELMKRFKINLRIENKETVVYFGDEKVDINAIQSDEISLAVSKVANIADNKDAYKVVSDIIDNLRKKYNVIFSGRDTMKIYNNLDYHFFIIADLDERVRRKLIQYNNNIDEKTLREHIKKRDNIQKQTGFYDTYDLTIIIDVTDCKDSVESAKKVLKHIKIKETI